MFSKKYKEIIENIIKKIQNQTDKELLDDYIAYHSVLMSLYARNLFKSHSEWTKIKKSYNVNYSYIRENNTSHKLTEIEKEIKCKLNLINNNATNYDFYKQELIDYIRYSMKMCINDIGIPFKIMSQRICNIINKYKNNDYVMKYTQKSKKLNYEVLEKLLFNQQIII